MQISTLLINLIIIIKVKYLTHVHVKIVSQSISNKCCKAQKVYSIPIEMLPSLKYVYHLVPRYPHRHQYWLTDWLSIGTPESSESVSFSPWPHRPLSDCTQRILLYSFSFSDHSVSGRFRLVFISSIGFFSLLFWFFTLFSPPFTKVSCVITTSLTLLLTYTRNIG